MEMLGLYEYQRSLLRYLYREVDPDRIHILPALAFGDEHYHYLVLQQLSFMVRCWANVF